MTNSYLINVYFEKFTYKFALMKGVVDLWILSHHSEDKPTLTLNEAKDQIRVFARDLPIRHRRNETMDELLTRHVLKEIHKRMVEKEAFLLHQPAPSYLRDADIKDDIWDLVCGAFGGFANRPDGIYGKPWKVGDEDVFIYRIHEQDVEPRFEFNYVRCFVHLGESVHIEFNTEVIPEDKLADIIRRAIERKKTA